MTDNIQITMKDIAEEFGVSVATVSRALSNNPRISKERREAIQAYAKEHNFFPNVIGEQLRHSRVKPIKLIGVIIPQLPHYYFSTILSGIEEEAFGRGYQMVVAQSNEQFEREAKICEAFYKNKVCGVIVSQAKNTVEYDHFRKLIDNGIPIVFYDRICTGVNASLVVVDDYMGAFNAVSHLIETGCKHIAYYGSPFTLEISKNRFNGYKDALLHNKLEVDEHIMRFCDNRSDAELITPELLQAENRPDAFFCVNDDTAIGVLYTVKRLGLRVPEDVSICGFTNGERAIACDPMLTTVEQRGKRVGEEAANILINKVEGMSPMEKIEKRVVRTKLIIRGTTR
ncbi:LacI family DNA-binding transcriptional regulator [Prevotella sp. kh1p2]|uniref:LacI family DNA-binding transcriptional regulator n=1 Tax=Prevotella sp. kh1p2 TaxID=1761883 RepID=UPI0008BD6C7F|nr:LacI family DNA-binding transcriptional regulator [Prevotella sp. kh1p2]SES93193.1 transcriptional regulator, LacI family [Prevotella sp. kh1p2]SNU11219.1 transcriptional regulator, LacI family [Prevotellaceae bacterium KH2P17]